MSAEPRTVELNVYHNGRGEIQVAIESVSSDGCAFGYRLLGPKFDGTGMLHRRHVLTKRDAAEIRRYLNMVETT
jgi:hypothetical protein